MLIHVSLDQIDDNPFQRRQEYGDIEDLAGRIAAARESYPDTYGLMQIPRGRVTVVDTDTVVEVDSVRRFAPDGRWNEDPDTFRVQLAFGHRRLRAFRHLHESGAAGYEDGRFPVHVDALTDQQMLDAVWAENRERKDISPVEEAELLHLKIEQTGGTQRDVADAWGLARSTVANRLRLLELPAEVQAANRRGELSERQCLALKPIIEIDQLTNGRVQWETDVSHRWNAAPAGPDVIIQKAIEDPGSFTSDVLREHAKKMREHAGGVVPDCIARHRFDMAGVYQHQCKGCRFRVNQHCLNTACLEKKTAAWPDIALKKFSEETGIPISDRRDDFHVDDYSARSRIKALYEDGETGGDMVCGWVLDCSAARPYGYDYVYGRGQFDKKGRAGIAIGWRGHVPYPETEKDDAPPYVLPERDKILAWDEEAPKIVRQARKQLVAAMTDALMYQVAEFDVLQALVFAADNEWIDDVEKLARQIVDFLINKGKGITWSMTFYGEVDVDQAAANRAGLDINVLGPPADALRKRAVLILDHWYDRHDSNYAWEETARRCLEWIDAWEVAAGALSGNDRAELKQGDIVDDVRLARRHIEEKLAAEAKSPDPDDYQPWDITDSAHFTCPACHEDAVSWQRGVGSCSECGNEMLIRNGEYWAKEITEPEPVVFEETTVSQEA